MIFILEFQDFSVEWFAFRKFNNFRIFWNPSQEISVPFVSVSKISEFLVQWKAPYNLADGIKFSGFPRKKNSFLWYWLKFSNISYWELPLPLPLDLLLKFGVISTEWIKISEIKQLLDFLKPFPENLRTIFPCFESSGIFVKCTLKLPCIYNIIYYTTLQS